MPLPLYLMAVELNTPDNWLELLASFLEYSGYETKKQNNRLIIWDRIQEYRGFDYANAVCVERLWLAPKRRSLSVSEKRIFFLEDNKTIDKRPEFVICEKVKVPESNIQERFVAQIAMLKHIKEFFSSHDSKYVKLDVVNLEKESLYGITINKIDVSLKKRRLSQIYRENGFDYVPNDIELYVCPLENVKAEYIRMYSNKLKKVLFDLGIECRVKITEESKIRKALVGLNTVKPGRVFLFILPSKENQVSKNTIELFDVLEKHGLPFRRAYADDDLDYSIIDQWPSLLFALGGRGHKSLINIEGNPIWTIGLDLGHSARAKFSNMAISLVNPEGEFIKGWVARKKLDEGIDAKLVTEMLKSCKKEILFHDDCPHIVVIRDGMFFKNDRLEEIKNIIGGNTTILEYRKYNNPIVFKVEESSKPIYLNSPYAAIVPGENTIFASALINKESKSFPKTAKVTWKSSLNDMQLSPEQIAYLLIRSSISPGLGLHNRYKPACIYWADGIALTSENDLRFRGQRVCWL